MWITLLLLSHFEYLVHHIDAALQKRAADFYCQHVVVSAWAEWATHTWWVKLLVFLIMPLFRIVCSVLLFISSVSFCDGLKLLCSVRAFQARSHFGAASPGIWLVSFWNSSTSGRCKWVVALLTTASASSPFELWEAVALIHFIKKGISG